MKIVIASVAQKAPYWVVDGWEEYIKRLPSDWSVELKDIKPEPRTLGKTPAKMMLAEAQRIEQAISQINGIKIALDEHGQNLTTKQFSQMLSSQALEAQTIVLIIGGPDGLDPTFKSKCNQLVRISSMTLPHALVRVLLAEQLYRAWSILAGHPYHRE
jgi:23S rRNA (pseudouridine1915-N3)-methyltransferase